IPGLIVPVFTKIFLDDVLLGGKIEWLQALLYGMGVTALVTMLLTWLRQHYLLKLQQKLSLSMAGQYLWHVLRLPVEFFQQRYAGDISSRMDSNDKVAQFIAGELATTVLNMVMIVFYFLMMLQYSVPLSLIGVLGAGVNIGYLKYVSGKRVDLNRKMMQDIGKFMSASMSGLQIIETLKATGSESDYFAKWAGSQARVLVAQQEMGSVSSILGRLPTFITAVTDTLVLGFGGFLIMKGNLTIGSLVAFQLLMFNFLSPVGELVGMGSRLQEMQADMNRLDDVFKYPLDVSVQKDKLELKEESCERLAGFVEIKDLIFGYSPLEKPLIEGFCLKLNPGSRVALVGGSGSGKSTIAKLIGGLYQPWSGEILFDDKNQQEIPRLVLNSSMAVVDQDISMFSGTIRDNITLWDKSISEKDMIQAAKDACIHDDIASRAGGYDTEVAEGGNNFSGGQRQRLEIARALVNKPNILIMDEATSALDPLTEKAVDENIRRRGCTCIIVAHRLSTIRDCDEIIVLENGKIMQRGTHEELINCEGHYANLINAG
ncbi:MAG: ABC transporter transmembrane domain-containing protein, partial [Eubacteriales bacterium]